MSYTDANPQAAQHFRPETEEQVLDAVQWAISQGEPVEIRGHGSKSAIGRTMQTAHMIDLSALSGVTLYEPEELVISAKAGTPISEIHALLEASNQHFAFEPMDIGPLLTGESAPGTIGGMLSANLSGPRRLSAGAVRDHVLGIRAVTGRGDLIKSGGRVVKNVTGYDLSKGLAGSWGTLAVLTEVTFKALPRPEIETTLVVSGLDDAAAAQAMAAALGSREEVTAAAHLPESVRAKFIDGGLPDGAATVLRLEGFDISVSARADVLEKRFAAHAPVSRLDAETSRTLWREVRDVKPFCDGTQKPVWRVSVAPSAGHQLVAALRMEAGVDAFYDWQGGLVWMRMEADPEAELVRRHIAELGGGHATLVRAEPAVRNSVPVFQPQPAPLAALSSRLKSQFDPDATLNPGRMVVWS